MKQAHESPHLIKSSILRKQGHNKNITLQEAGKHIAVKKKKKTTAPQANI